MNLRAFKESGHWPTLATAFLYFDFSFMVWTLLGALAVFIGSKEVLDLNADQKATMVAVPILSGAILRLVLSLLVDRIGAKRTGLIAQVVVIAALALTWRLGLPSYAMVLVLGLALGVAGASFSVALPQAGRWYPPKMQGAVMGLAGAGNVGVVIDYLAAPKLAEHFGWQNVFGFALIPAVLVLALYWIFAKDAPGEFKKKTLGDYWALLKEKDAHWFCFYYTISFGGFVGLASYYALFFNGEFGGRVFDAGVFGEFTMTKVKAGFFAAMCTLAGALARPIGGFVADRVGGIRSLLTLYALAAATLVGCALTRQFAVCFGLFLVVSFLFGMANGSVFQLLPQRFGKDIGVMSGLVGCGGGLGGFVFAKLLGMSKEYAHNYTVGFLGFAGLCVLALCGLALVKTRWRTTWGAMAEARI